MRLDAKLTKICQYLGERMDSTTDKMAYMAYSIARTQVQELLFEILDSQLEENINPDCEWPG